jgi:membrane protease YdiL (CAAX protease family)
MQAGGLANTIFIATPWLANLAARLFTREGWGGLGLRPNFKRGWPFYVAAWLLPLLVSIVGGVAFYLLFPQSYDPNLSSLQKLVANTPSAAADPWTIFLSTALSMLIISVPINMLVSMGEEFGWRAYLLPKLVQRFSPSSSPARTAALLTGVIHGVWHWPLFLLTASLVPGFNLLSLPLYLVLTCSLSVLFSWVTLRSGSVWPAALAHGAVNATSALPGFLLLGQAIPLLGPDVTGLIGGIGYTLLALVLFFSRAAFAREKDAPGSEAVRLNPAVR